MSMPTEDSKQETDSLPRGANPRPLRDWIEIFARNWALLLASIYAAGFVIFSEYRSSFGLNEVAALRPQIPAAGAVYAGVMAVSYFVWEWAFGPVRQISKSWSIWKTYFFKMSFGLFNLLLNDLFAAWALQMVFRFSGPQPLPVAFPITAVLLWTAMAVVQGVPRSGLAANILGHPIAMVFSLLSFLFLAAASVPLHGEFGIRQLALYLFAVQIAMVPIRKAVHGVADNNWVTLTAQMLLPMLAYGVFIFPHVRAALGGGEAVTVSIMTASPNGPTHPPESFANVQVVDETDAGFYILESGGTNVTFIPRASVYSMKFVRPPNGQLLH